MSLSPAFREVVALPWPEIESRRKRGLISDGVMEIIKRHKPPPDPFGDLRKRSDRVQSAIHDAVVEYEKRGISRDVALDKAIYNPALSQMHRLERQLKAAEHSARLAKGDDKDKYSNKLDELVTEHMQDFPKKSRSEAYDAVLRSKKGRKLVEKDRLHRAGMAVDDDEEDDDDRATIDKLGGQRLPSQRADEQSFPRAAGNVDPATIVASDRKILNMIADAQTRRTLLDLQRRNNLTMSEAIAEAKRLGIRLPKAVLDATADADFPGEHSGPLQKLEAMAAWLRDADPSLSAAQAFNKVYGDPQNRHLVRDEYAQRMSKMYGG